MEDQVAPKAKILIVEDEGIIALRLAALLRELGYEVVDTVFSGEKAMELIGKSPPDLVLMDIILDGRLDGIETAEFIRACWKIPVVFLTAYADKERLERAKLVSPFGYLVKPFQDNDVKITVEMALYVFKVNEERRKAEEALRKSEERFRDLFTHATLAIFQSTFDGKVISVNPMFAKLFGYQSPEEVCRTVKNVATDVFADPERREEIVRLKREHPDWNTFENLYRRKDGSTFLGLLNVREIKDINGQVVAFEGFIEDITDRKRIEAALAQSVTRFKELTDLLPESVFELDGEGKLTYCNRQFFTLFGYSPVDLEMELPVHHLVVPEEQDRARKAMQQELNGQLPKVQEYTLRKKDGSLMPVTIHSSPIIQDEQIVGIRGIIVDISEAKKREKERLVLSKLESTGMLAAGLAHDFNNLLAIILGNLQVAKMSLDLGEQIAVFLDAAEKGVLSARELTRQLITFSKEELPIKKPVVLSHLLREQALFTLSGSSVKSDFSFAPDLWAVEADENQLAQSFRNIILNSREAMPQGGIIMVKAENVEVTGDGRWPLPTGNYVKITISDQGSGIPEKILPRIFDPYFSTKQRGIQKGMGLGLTICHSVIKKHGGLITATSKPDEGTTMTIYLPASATQISIRSSPKDHAARDSKILIMDDEEMVRTMARALLGRMGFQVEVAEKGEQAVELYQKAMALECPFDAVILDLTVRGGMGGKETIEKLLQIDPGVRAIVSSGYDEDPVMRNYDQYGFKGVLAKPYLISDLSDALAKVLKPGKRERAEKIKDQ